MHPSPPPRPALGAQLAGGTVNTLPRCELRDERRSRRLSNLAPTDQPEEPQILVTAANAYWWAYSYPGSTGIRYLMSVPLTGGTAAPIATGVLADTLALDATHIYWTDYDDGLIMSLPLAGGIPTTLCLGQPLPQGIAVDHTSVYWGTVGLGSNPSGTIVMLELP